MFLPLSGTCRLPKIDRGECCRMHPELVGVQGQALVQRMVQLRALLPGAHLAPAVRIHACLSYCCMVRILPCLACEGRDKNRERERERETGRPENCQAGKLRKRSAVPDYDVVPTWVDLGLPPPWGCSARCVRDEDMHACGIESQQESCIGLHFSVVQPKR